jgi:hypothetical protein
MGKHEHIDFVLHEVKSVAVRRHRDTEQVAAPRRILRLVGVDPARIKLFAGDRIDLNDR